MRRAPPHPVTQEAMYQWLVAEQEEREAFEQHVKGELRDIKTVLDTLLKIAEQEEKQLDAIEHARTAHV